MVKVWRTKESNSPNACHEPTYDNEGTNPYCPWNRDHLLESALGFSGGMGPLVHGPGWGRTAQPNAVRTHGDMLYTRMCGPVHAHWKRGW